MNIDLLIEAPFNLGLKEPSPGIEPGVRFLPDALNKIGFGKRLGLTPPIRIPAPPYQSIIDPESGIRNAQEINLYSRKLISIVSEKVTKGSTPLVIGGDCSILIGIMVGLKTNGQYGLFFIDGHTDFVTLEQSATKAAAGMDLAIVAGLGHDLLADIDGLKPYVREEHIFCFGNRVYDDAYEATVVMSKVNYYPLSSIHQMGIPHITASFLTMVATEKLTGFWVHLDADVLNDDLMPCVDSRTPGGLSYDALRAVMIPLLSSPYFAGLSITILDPTLDKDDIVVKTFAEKLVEILG